jgi:Tol biopolymer transport system component
MRARPTVRLAVPLVAALWMAVCPATHARQALGTFEGTTDIGPVGVEGSLAFDPVAQRYTVTGSGENMWFGSDAFRFVWRRVSGDFTIRARVAFRGDGGHQHRKIGVIARTSLDPGSPYVDVAVHGDGMTSMQYRRSPGADTEEVRSAASGPDVVQLERRGDRFVMSVARFGEPLATETLDGPALGDDLYVGLFVCSHDNAVLETADFDNVRLVVPPPDGWVPYRDYIGSRLEVLEVDTGHRRVFHRSKGSIQAPNWTPDGKALIFNQDGLLYRFDLASRVATPIDTEFATRNNNDHVLSFDGSMLGISHHSEDHDGQSIVYTVPVSGGVPRLVTPVGPSYLHGWSPDGRHLVYTAQRGGDYDIYRIPAGGGDEVRLTDAPGLDDGPEYAPDGRSIWFNSVRSGTMQLWRMGADGSKPTRMTRDGYNDWFPHVSPDGSRVVFLSFMADVDPSDHPFYRPVYLRMMPVGGGEPRIIAYVFGGQGTINVPSWSPDGRFVAFVSNSDLP